MSGAEVYLKFKAWLDDKVSSGMKRVMGTVEAASNSAKKLSHAMGDMIGHTPGMGKLAGAIGEVFTVLKNIGPVGAVFAASQAAMSLWAESAKDAAEKFAASVERMAERVKSRYEELNRRRLDKLNESLKEATTLADRAAKAFDTMAAAYLKISSAKSGTKGAAFNAEMSGMELEKSNAMAKASEGDRALVGAAHDVKIAEAKLARAAEAAAEDVKTAQQGLKDARQRNKMATEREIKARNALADAEDELALTKEADPKKTAEYQARVDAAQAALANAINDSVSKKADLAAADEKLKQARLNETASIGRAKRDLVEAESAKKSLELAKQKADEAAAAKVAAESAKRMADEERRLAQEKRDAERALVEQRKAQVDDLKNQRSEQLQQMSLFKSDLAEARSNLANAWRLYRDKSAMKAVMDEEQAQKDAEKSWQKDFDRLRSRRRDWRTADNLSVDERATREVALAKERQNEAERHLAEIEKNTSDLSSRIDQLLQMKGGE